MHQRCLKVEISIDIIYNEIQIPCKKVDRQQKDFTFKNLLYFFRLKKRTTETVIITHLRIKNFRFLEKQCIIEV